MNNQENKPNKKRNLRPGAAWETFYCDSCYKYITVRKKEEYFIQFTGRYMCKECEKWCGR